MKIYESLVLVSSELAGDAAVEHVQSLIEKHAGEIIRIEKYAEQRLAYEIKKQRRGIYVLVAFRQAADKVAPLERDFSLNEQVLRSLILDRSGMTIDQFFRRYDAADEKSERPEPVGAR